MNVVAVSYIASGYGNERVKKKAIYCKDDVADMGGIQDHAVLDFFSFFSLFSVFSGF